MGDSLKVSGMLSDLAGDLESLGDLLSNIETAARLRGLHLQQRQKLADYCNKIVQLLRTHIDEWIKMPSSHERERHERCRGYITQMTLQLEETKDRINEISNYTKFDALVKQFKIKDTIIERRVALADCLSRFAITSQLDFATWEKEFTKAAGADRDLLVRDIPETHHGMPPTAQPWTADTQGQDIDTVMRKLQVYMRTYHPESVEYRNAESTLREVQKKAQMRLLPLADLVLEARKSKTGEAPVYYSATAEIWKGIWLNDPNTIVALKCFRARIGTELLRFHWQVQIIRSIQHRNIIKLYDVRYGDTLCFVFPWMNNGNIMAYLAEKPDADRMGLMLDVARGIAHLHAQDSPMVHSALQPSNVLVDDEGRAIVADFGLMEAVESFSHEIHAQQQTQMAMRWMAPELNEGRYGMPADAYAWAMTALQVISGLQPFYLMELPSRVVIAVNGGERPKREQYAADMFTDQCWKLLEDCWKQDPAERLRMNEVVQRIEEMRPDLAVT